MVFKEQKPLQLFKRCIGPNQEYISGRTIRGFNMILYFVTTLKSFIHGIAETKTLRLIQ